MNEQKTPAWNCPHEYKAVGKPVNYTFTGKQSLRKPPQRQKFKCVHCRGIEWREVKPEVKV